MNSGPVVTNTTPLINLAGVGLLDILPQLYGEVLAPRAVISEFQAKTTSVDPDLNHVSWLKISEQITVIPSLPKLGAGETAAISLAKATLARLILLDEKKARAVALSQGLTVVGTLAVLVRAKNTGVLPAVKPHLHLMQSQGRRFSETLIARILEDAGEARV